MGDKYFNDVGPGRGKEVLMDCPKAVDAGSEDYAAHQAFLDKKQANFHERIPVDMRYMPELLSEAYDNLVWPATARRCFSCGSCNLVCPTCYCFDVKDETDLHLQEGRRYRAWDGCLLEDFAKVGSGENFRKERVQRYRHRFYRKGRYLHQRYGDIACVGCGRCASACLPDVADPVVVYNTLKEER